MPSTGSSPVVRINRAEIARLGIEAIKDIGEIVPNLYSPAYGSRMTSSIYMRGLGSRMDQAVVGLNVDGVSYLNKDAYDFDITDIASVEVTRGAQSVLNGRNAMAGQINVYTLSPRDYQGFRAMLEYGRANTTKASAGYYAKITDKLFSSLTGGYTHSDGFWRNGYNNKRVGAENSGAMRWKTVFLPTAWHSITNTASMSISRQSGYPYASVATGQIAYNDTCYYKRNVFSDGLTVAWAGKRVVVTSLTSVQYIDDDMTLDQDFTPADYFTLTQRRHEFNFTEDLFTKGVRGNYSWLGGVFGFYRHTNMSAPVTFFDTGIANLIEAKRNQMNPTYPIEWNNREFLLSSDFKSPSGGIALYHESKYSLGNWTFEAGLRWDFEHISCNYRSVTDASYTTWHVLDDGSREVYNVTPVDINDSGKLTQTFNQLLPKVTATYNFNQGYAYASFTKGYKAGGFNTQMFSDVLQQRVMSTMGLSMAYSVDEIVSYRPEKSYNYEVGTKVHLLDGCLTAEAVGFFIDCRDRQLTVFPPGMVTGRIMTNAGRTHSLGAELTAKYSPIEDLSFTASYGYTNATFSEYNNGKADYSGKRVPYAPAHTLFASALWRMPVQVAGLTPVLNVNMRGTGDIMWDEANTVRQPFYALAGASLAFEGNGWSFKIWGENITNTRYDSFYFVSMSNAFVQRGNPVTYGATIRLNIN
jgi:outer membrane receptor protein involved in Fe transport